MQVIGSIVFLGTGVAALSAFWVFLYAALPEAVLAYAERHGRFQGLRIQETLARGTKAGQPPVGRQMALAE